MFGGNKCGTVPDAACTSCVALAPRPRPSVGFHRPIGYKCGEWRLGAVATWLPVRMRIMGPYAMRPEAKYQRAHGIRFWRDKRRTTNEHRSERIWHGQRTSTFPQRDSFAGTFVARRARTIKPCRAAPCHGRRRHHTRTSAARTTGLEMPVRPFPCTVCSILIIQVDEISPAR